MTSTIGTDYLAISSFSAHSFSSQFFSVGFISTDFFSAFGAGLLACLTPCVYPLIPVTLAVCGARAEQSRLRAFLLSLSYVMGLALTYTALGMITAKTGAIFGAFLGNPWIVLPLAIFFALLALSSLDLIPMGWLSALQTRAGKIGGSGAISAFLMGLVSGFVAAPCVGPVVAGILLLAARSADIVYGGLLLFTFSLGLGLPFLILGTFSSLVASLPKSGNWLRVVKFIIAVGLFLVSYVLLAPIAPRLFALLLERGILLGLTLVAIFATLVSIRRQSRWGSAVAALLLALPAFAIISPNSVPTSSVTSSTSESSANNIPWYHDLESAKEVAAREGKPLMVDLFAEWCAACKELRRETFPDSAVKQALGAFIPVELDFTEESPLYEVMVSRYSVIGLPTILFLNADGSEIKDSKITGFLPPPQFINHLEKVLRTRHHANDTEAKN